MLLRAKCSCALQRLIDRARHRCRKKAIVPKPAKLAKPVHAAAGNGMAVAFEGDADRDTFSGGGGNDTIYVDRGQTPDTVSHAKQHRGFVV